MSLKKELGNFIGDVSKLQVTTLTGDLSLNVLLDDTNKNIQFKNILNTLKVSEGQPSKVEVVATTEVDFDKDVIQYVKKNADPSLLDLHNKTMISSQNARAEFIKAIIDFIL